MNDGNTWCGVGAIGCAGLVLAHLWLTSGDETPAPQPVPKQGIAQGMGDVRSDAERWDEWRESRAPTLLDSKAEREEKQFSDTMKAHRQQPVEIVDDPGRSGGLVEIGSVDDLRRLLEEGGSYSGPLPPELQSEFDAAEEGASKHAHHTTKSGGVK